MRSFISCKLHRIL